MVRTCLYPLLYFKVINCMVELDIANDTLKFPQPHSVDLGVPYFGATHAPYAALGLFGGVVIVILPLVLVSIYPTRMFPKLIGC